MQYKDFEYDFVQRTLDNLKWIDEKSRESTIGTFYEFTNLVNQCLGLIVFPKELADDVIMNSFPQDLHIYGISDTDIEKIKNNNSKTLSNVFRHLRNGIAHGHIQQNDDTTPEISEIVIWDIAPKYDTQGNVIKQTKDDAHTIIKLSVQQLKNLATTIAEKNIRVYDMKPRVYTDNINWDSIDLVALNRHEYTLPTSWQRLNVANAKEFSAIACHFAAVLSDSLNVPIGLICNAVGGAPIESFIDRKTMEHHPVLVDILDNWTQNDFVQEWVRGRAMYNIKNSKNKLQRHPYEPCYLFETSVASIAGYPLKGVIWYQGESNAHNVELFEVQFPALVHSWRTAWADTVMPFHFVQLSSIARPTWPHFRDVQRRLAEEIPHCGMAVSSDHGDSLDVHPRHKRPIGERLARIALHHDYGYSHVASSGPAIRHAERDGEYLVLRFDHGCGMKSSDGQPLRTFEVADEHGQYRPADEVEVRGNTIRLHSKHVRYPHRARYGWQPFTRANLINAAGLPASTFEIAVKP